MDNFDKNANLSHYHTEENVLNVLKNFTNREYKVVNRRVNRMKTFYRRTFPKTWYNLVNIIIYFLNSKMNQSEWFSIDDLDFLENIPEK